MCSFRIRTPYWLQEAKIGTSKFGVCPRLSVFGRYSATKTPFVRWIFQGMIRCLWLGATTSTFLSRYFRIWDLKSGECDFKYKGSQNVIYDVQFSPTMSTIAYTNTKKIFLFSLEFKSHQGVLLGHENLIREIAFDETGDLLCSGNWMTLASEDNQIRLWSLKTKLCVAIMEGLENSSYGFRSLAYAHGKIVAGTFDGDVMVWKIQNQESVKVKQWSHKCLDLLKGGWRWNRLCHVFTQRRQDLLLVQWFQCNDSGFEHTG